MKRLILFFVLFTAGILTAQVQMSLKANNKRYIQFERIDLTLTMRNDSGNTLIFSRGEGSLTFLVKTRSGNPVQKLDSGADPIQGLVFAPGQVRELKLTINALYDLQKSDFYTVEARLEHPRLKEYIYRSQEVAFEVKTGIPLTSRTVGLPAQKDTDPIHIVKATLLRFNDGTDDIYTLLLDDDEMVYGTFRIGPFIQGSRPQLESDASSSIHVLVQLRPRLYAYNVYSIVKGVAKIRQQRYYIPKGGNPYLSRKAGYLKIMNAEIAKEGVDFTIKRSSTEP